MDNKTEMLILEALEMLLIFPESRTLQKEKSLLIFKLNQARSRLDKKKQ
jgi:hypothetical protein